jgi:hypothetical protein
MSMSLLTELIVHKWLQLQIFRSSGAWIAPMEHVAATDERELIPTVGAHPNRFSSLPSGAVYGCFLKATTPSGGRLMLIEWL